MEEKHIRAKKSLGQHFLRSKTALQQILSASHLSKEDDVLEIGPGEGALTRELLATGAKVTAIETDGRCVEILKELFSAEIEDKRLILIQGDIRSEVTQKELFSRKALANRPYKLIANIPYYITGFLFRLFLEHLNQPTQIIFLIQKEVAHEIVARDGKEGILSLSVKAYGDTRIVAKVKREAFSPAPKVDSSIISVENISKDRLGRLSDDQFFRVVKAGLHAKRKMLLGNLKQSLGLQKKELETIFEKLHISTSIRGEDVPIEQWISLAKEVSVLVK